jgi:selenium metabolism protein YedF
MKSLDCRGLACPNPVLKAKELVEHVQPELFEIIVDNEAARQNVMRFLESRHFDVSVEQEGSDFHVLGKSSGKFPETVPGVAEDAAADTKKIMVMAATDRMGRGDEELGAKLMVNFLKTLKEMGKELWRLVFVNNGVKLTIDGSAALPALKELEESDVTILVCGTCLDHFNLLERKQVGETTNMLDIVTAMQIADKVINI